MCVNKNKNLKFDSSWAHVRNMNKITLWSRIGSVADPTPCDGSIGLGQILWRMQICNSICIFMSTWSRHSPAAKCNWKFHESSNAPSFLLQLLCCMLDWLTRISIGCLYRLIITWMNSDECMLDSIRFQIVVLLLRAKWIFQHFLPAFDSMELTSWKKTRTYSSSILLCTYPVMKDSGLANQPVSCFDSISLWLLDGSCMCMNTTNETNCS